MDCVRLLYQKQLVANERTDSIIGDMEISVHNRYGNPQQHGEYE
jgi:hypothetical protein